MKIAFDISQIVYPGTGVGKYVRDLIEHLVGKYDDNFILFGSSLRKYSELKKFQESIKKRNVHTKLLPIPPTILSILWNDLHQFPIEKFIGNVDIFHSSDWTSPPTKAINITTIYDLIVFKYPQTSDTGIISTQKKRLQWVKKETDMIIAISQNTKKDIIDIMHIPDEKIRVIYPGLDKNFEKKSITEIIRVKKKYNITGDYILSLGTLEPRKNIAQAIEAFNYFQHADWKNIKNPVQLVLVGKTGWGNAPIPVGENIKTLGYVDDVDIPSVYSGASMFVYPSLYEGFGYPVAEAMACGVPVLTSNRGSLKETAGNAGIYINPEDPLDIAQKMIELYKDENRRRKFIDRGFSQVKQFSMKNMTTQTFELYKELYEKRNKT